VGNPVDEPCAAHSEAAVVADGDGILYDIALEQASLVSRLVNLDVRLSGLYYVTEELLLLPLADYFQLGSVLVLCRSSAYAITVEVKS
jgi:hypothetical protein